MASTTLARARAEIESLRSRAASVRARANKSAEIVQRDAVTVGAAYAYGAWRKSGGELPSIFGLDSDEVAVLALYAASHAMSGRGAELAHDASVGIAAAYAYRKANS